MRSLHLSLRTKMTLVVVGLVLLLMLLTAFISLNFFEKEYENTLTSHQVSLLQLLADNIDGEIKGAQDALMNNAKAIPKEALVSKTAAVEWLNSRIGLITRFFTNQIMLVTPDGHIHASYPALEIDYANQPVIKATFADGRQHISNPVICCKNSKDLGVIFTAPVLSDGKVVMVLSGSFSLYKDNILSRYLKHKITPGGFLRIISDKHLVVLHHDIKRINEPVAPDAIRGFDNAFSSKDGKTETFRHIGNDQRDLITSAQRLKTVNWLIASSYFSEEMYAPIARSHYWFVVATLAGMGCATILVFAMMRLLTRPLAQLADHLNRLPEKKGDERFIHLPVNGEIGNLSKAFNKMLMELDSKNLALIKSKERYRIVTEFTNDFTYWMRPDDTFEFVSPACLTVTGYTREELIAKPELMQEMIYPADRQMLKQLQLESREKADSKDEEIEYRIITKSGSIRWIRHTCRLIYDENNQFLGRRGCRTDITEKKMLADQVSHMVLHDLLTGLPNRSLFADRLFQLTGKKDSYLQEMTVVLFFGVDRFKMINDTLGHDVGDQLLIMLAERLRKLLHPNDTLCRFAGDVFAFILPGRESRHEAVTMSYRILSSLTEPFTVSGQQVNITGSIGIAICPMDGCDTETLQKSAETAMYDAKKTGKNCFRFYAKEMNAQASEMLKLDNSMPKALINGDFYLHYQPQLDLKNDTVIAVEALLRWRHTELGIISPDRFIPLAEDSGFIIKLGEWVLRTACVRCTAWQKTGSKPIRVAVNVSGRQFSESDFIDMVAAVLAESGLPPELLELELTESLLISNEQQVLQKLKLLKNMGINLAIDDFGTGYSSLSYLKHFPLDRLKIDKSFINDILTDSDDASITEAIIAMAHSLKLKVIAEGVETREQLVFLEDRGCDEMQGYYLSKPLSENDLAHFIKSREEK